MLCYYYQLFNKKSSRQIKCVSSKKRLIKVGLYKLRLPKLSDSSMKFIPKKQRKSKNVPIVERTESTRSKKRNKVSGGMVGTRSQKASEEKGQCWKYRSTRNGSRRLTSESKPVERSHDFATSTRIFVREEMSELSDISTERTATSGSPTDNTMMHGVREKAVTSSSFSE